jgi:hypothetical protein
VRKLVVALALAVAAALAVPALPADAAPKRPASASDILPYNGYNLSFVCHYGNCSRGEVEVEVWGDILYNADFVPTHTRGYGKVTNRTALRVRIDKVNLGSRFGVEQTVGAGSSTTGVARRATPWDRIVDAANNPDPSAPCDYRVRVYFSVRWRDGTLGRGSLLSDWYDNPNAPTCRA